MSDPSDQPKRRLGPVGFHAESKVTNSPKSPGENRGGISEASGPTLETPRRSKELKVWGLKVWAISGTLLLILGIVTLWPILIAAGALLLFYAIFSNRIRKTESRIRNDLHREGDR
jgi:hypothetical protein